MAKAPFINNGSVVPMYPEVTVSLEGKEHGDKECLMLFVAKRAARAGLRPFEIEEFMIECIASDYEGTLETVRRWFKIEGEV